MSNKIKKSALLLVASALAWTSAAHAEELPKNEEIVVSARYRTEQLQNTPIAITAVNKDLLDAKATTSVSDLTATSPSLIINHLPSAANVSAISIRGMSLADPEKSFDPTVGVVVDGVFIGTNTGQYLDFFDYESIEVLRGPQGTLFGRNTIGGVVNLRRTTPTGKFGANVQTSYGSYDTLTTRAVVNLPETNNISTKLFYYHSENGGWLTNGETGKKVGGYNNENFGASFLYHPSEDFDLLLTLEKQVQDSNPYTSNITKTGEVFCAFSPANQCNRNNTTDLYTVYSPKILGKEPFAQYEAPAATLEVNYDLGKIKLTSITGYREAKEWQQQNLDGTSVDLYTIKRYQYFRQISQELRASGNINDRIDYVVGGYFFDGKYDYIINTRLFGIAENNPTLCNLVGGPAVAGCGWLGGSPELANANRARGGTTSYAIFADVNTQLTDNLRLEVGGRYTHDRKWLNQYFFTTLGDSSKNFSNFSPRVSVDYKPTDNTMLYASWSRGYRSGGYSLRGLTPISATTHFNPETVDSYEVGVKSSLLNDKVFVSLSGFIADYKDMQQFTITPGGPTGNETILSNVGSSQIKGIEGEITVRPVTGLTLNGSVSLMNNKFKGFITNSPNPLLAPLLDTYDYSNIDMVYAPKFMGMVSANYTTETKLGKLEFNLSYRHINEYSLYVGQGSTSIIGTNNNGTVNYRVNEGDPRLRSPSVDLVDASISTTFPINGVETKLTLYGRNLTDERGPVSGAAPAGMWAFAFTREPRSYGVSLGVKF